MEKLERGWNEQSSLLYLDLSQIAVPHRAENLAMIISLVPFTPDAKFRFLDLGCGAGEMSAALLTTFPNSQCVAIDSSEEMRTVASQLLAPFEERVSVEDHDMGRDFWIPHLEGAGLVVSSLAIHHLTDEAKRTLFQSVARLTVPHAAMIYFDVVGYRRPEAWQAQAETYDIVVRSQSQRTEDSNASMARFKDEHWNIFRYPDPDIDILTPLADQLNWLGQAGFAYADCFSLHAGHAVIGAYKSDWRGDSHGIPSAGVTYESALSIVRRTLNWP